MKTRKRRIYNARSHRSHSIIICRHYLSSFDKFMQICDTFSTSFRLFLSKTWSRTCCEPAASISSRYLEIDAAGSQQVRWFVRVLVKWNVEKTVSSQPMNLMNFRYLFYYSSNVPTSIVRYYTHIIGFQFLKQSALRIISVSVSSWPLTSSRHLNCRQRAQH